MRIVIPKDWSANPAFIRGIKDMKLKEFGAIIHSKWKSLTRRFDRGRLCKECQASSLELPYPFIVPGGRFREFYYWDSYWILEGLYVSEMCTTASGMIENMLVMIEEFGFIPNGARIYYMNRSQPPMFTMMIERYANECIRTDEERKEFFQRVLLMIEKEYEFWMKERSAEIHWKGHNHILNVYRTEHWMPRPESFSEDTIAAADKHFDTDLKKQQLFQNIASAAESGWDFSERWFNHSKKFSTIRTIKLVPTDLNAIMHKNEMIISHLFERVGNSEKAKSYRENAARRLVSINALLYRDGRWTDLDLESMGPARNTTFISDLTPILLIDSIEKDKIFQSLKLVNNLLFKYPSGIPANEHVSGQQWDFPNVWAPIQQLVIKLYLRLDNSARGENYFKALNIAQRWIDTTYCGYEMFSKQHFAMFINFIVAHFIDQIFEKYHAELIGHPGGGGEYIVQEGFGWTNGVILWILQTFGNDLVVPTQCAKISLKSAKKSNRLWTVFANMLITVGLLFKIR